MSVSKEKIRKYQRSDKMSTSYSSSSESSSEEETCMRDLKSIKEYLSDRRELASQLFKSVKSDKIRIMLPQILKKIDLKELEELCANELSGMSRKRILSIINAQQMLESSDTNESDDSGPSLEIISDADECFSDETNKNKTKKTSKLKSKTRNDKTKVKVKSEAKDKPSKCVVKVEGEKESKKEKEGDSLLDLLELEMRARAIRALIRKEEDLIPSTSDGQSSVSTKELEKQISMVKQRVISELSCQQLDELMKQSEEEDVVLVVEPTTVIELLSTDDETEQQAQPNGIDGQTKIDDLTDKLTNNTSPALPDQVQDSNKIDKTVETKESNESSTNNENNKTSKDTTKEANVQSQTKQEKNKKSKKKSVRKARKKSDSLENKKDVSESKNEDVQEKISVTKVEPEESKEKDGDSVKKVEKKIIDNDLEIIDLDYYPDDMDDMEDGDGHKVVPPVKTSDETWASRYFKTDDVQSVIKESKIQSEIRKRLRERQRLNKINNSPTNVESTQNVEKVPVEEFNPIGSVQEYLALKATMSANNNEDTQSSLVESEACSSGKGSQVELSADDSSRTSAKDENVPDVLKADNDTQNSKAKGEDDEKCTKQDETSISKSQCVVNEIDDSNKACSLSIDEKNTETINSDLKIVTDVKLDND